MKKLFVGKYRRIPVALLTAVLIMLMGASTILAAGYTVVNGTVTVRVVEAFEVEASWDGGATWFEVDPVFDYEITGAYPGDVHTVLVKVTNNSGNTLSATLDVAGPSEIDVTFLPTSLALNVLGGTYVSWNVTGVVASDAAPGDYVLALSLSRDAAIP
jgi:uncharacterized membrane protein